MLKKIYIRFVKVTVIPFGMKSQEYFGTPNDLENEALICGTF